MAQPSLDEVVANYLTAVESGERPDREKLLAEHPHHAIRLREFFQDLDEMNRVVRANVDGTLEFTPPSIAAVKKRPAERFATTDPSASKRIGSYKLLQLIGSGGMGEVWMAEQEQPIRRRVALKLIKTGMDSKQVVARFEAERQALAMMDHQNIAKVFDGGSTEEGCPYFVMELVQGVPVTQYCDRNKMSINDRLDLFLPICHAVQHAHQKGIIHRDLKPSNILVTLYDGQPVPKVIDFGLAKALQHQSKLTNKTLFTEFGQVVGTLQYMSPEQAEMNALDVDTRTDVYALGVLLYELLTGSTPIDRSTLEHNAVYKVLETIREQDPPRPSVRLSASGDGIAGISQQRQIEPNKLGEILRGDLDWIVMRALEKDRTRRYATANSFAEDIRNFLDGDTVNARPPSAGYRFQKFFRKNRSLVLSLICIAAFLTFAAVISTTFGIYAFHAKARADESEKTAVSERTAADKARSRAESEAQIALDATVLATKSRDRSYHLLAQSYWEDGRANEANRFLDLIPDESRKIDWYLLKRRFEGSFMTLYGHEDAVISVDVSPNGELIATGSVDSRIILWDSITGDQIRTLTNHQGTVNEAVFDADSTHLVSCSDDGKVKLWDVSGGTELLTLDADGSPVRCVSFSRDGQKIAAGTGGKNIFIWNASTGHLIKKLVGHEGPVESVAFSPDGATLVSTVQGFQLYEKSGDAGLKIWNLQEGREASTDIDRSYWYGKAKFNPRGGTIAIGGYRGDIIIVDSLTGKSRSSVAAAQGVIEGISLSPTGDRIAIASDDGLLKVVELNETNKGLRLRGHQSGVASVAFYPDGSRIATCGYDNTVKIWNLSQPDQAIKLSDGKNRLYDIEFSADGELVALSSGKPREVAIFDSSTNKLVSKLNAESADFRTIAFSPKDHRLYTTLSNQQIAVWDADTGLRLNQQEVSSKELFLTDQVFSPDRSEVLSAYLHCWDCETGNLKRKHPAFTAEVLCACFSSDGSLIAAGDSHGSLQIVDAKSGKVIRVVDYVQDGAISSIAFSPDGQFLATGSDYSTYLQRNDKCITILDSKMFRPIRRLVGHQEGIMHLSFSRDSDYILSSSYDWTVKLWDANSGEELLSFRGVGNDLSCAEFSPDGKVIATDSGDGSLKIWSSVLDQAVTRLAGHRFPVTFVALSSDGSRIYSEAEHPVRPNAIERFVWDIQKQTFRSVEQRPEGFFAEQLRTEWQRIVRNDKEILIIEYNRRDWPKILSYRRAMATPQQSWYATRASKAEANEDWYSGAFYRAWESFCTPSNESAKKRFHENLNNFRTSTKDKAVGSGDSMLSDLEKRVGNIP